MQSVLSIDSLEPRRMMAVDLAVSYNFETPLPLTTSVSGETAVTFTISNVGDTSAPSIVQAELFFSRDRKFDANDEKAAEVVAPGIRAGRKYTESDTVNLPQDPGRYYLIAIVDRAGVYNIPQSPFNETNRANNAIVGKKPQVTIVPILSSPIVNGTAASDKIGVIFSGDQVVVGVNGALSAVSRASFNQMTFNLGNGNDRFATNTDVSIPLVINGGSGNDRISGGAAGDLIDGGDDTDRLFGGEGNDTINAGTGNDRLFGGPGLDNLTGGTGGDFFFTSGDAIADLLFGGDGNDSAQADSIDVQNGIEVAIPL